MDILQVELSFRDGGGNKNSCCDNLWIASVVHNSFHTLECTGDVSDVCQEYNPSSKDQKNILTSLNDFICSHKTWMEHLVEVESTPKLFKSQGLNF